MSEREFRRARASMRPFIQLMLAVMCLAMIAGCGGGGGATSQPTEMVDDNFFQKSSIAPSIAIYGFGDSSFVSTNETVTIRGASNSASGKTIALTPNINGKDLRAATLDANGFYSFDAKLNPGENTLTLTAKELNGLTTTKAVVISYAKNASISKDLSINTDSAAQGVATTITANISFSDTSKIASVSILRISDASVLALMKDDGALPDTAQADGAYATQFQVTIPDSTEVCYKAKIILQDGGVYHSGIKCVHSYTSKSFSDYELLDNINKVVLAKYKALSSGLEKINKAKSIVNEIKNSSEFTQNFSEINYDDNGNIYWVTKAGLPGAFLVGTVNTKSIGEIKRNTYFYVSPYDAPTPMVGLDNKYSYSFASLRENKTFKEITPSLNDKTLEVFKTFYNGGAVHIATHGGQAKLKSGISTVLATGVVLPKYLCKEPTKWQKFWNYLGEPLPADFYCTDITTIKKYADNCTSQGCLIGQGGLEDGSSIVLIYPRYLKLFLKDDLKDSLIFIDACHSMENTDLRDIFFSKGAAAFIGWHNSVLISYSREFSKSFYDNLNIGKTVTESIDAAKLMNGNTDKQSKPAYIEHIFNPASGFSDLKISLKTPETPWKTVWFTVANNYVPIRLNSDGVVQCASSDGVHCFWTTTAESMSAATQPITCNAEAEAITQHWCAQMKDMLTMQWVERPNTGKAYAVGTCGNWRECESKARVLNATLVAVNDQAEDTWLKSTFSMSTNYWIGATNDGVVGQWRWVTGDPFSYTNWGQNLNNNGGNEFCAHYYDVTPGIWNDVACNSPNIKGLFEKEIPM